MLDRLRQLLAHRLTRNTAIYALGGFTQEAVPFLLLPVLTRYLSPYDYGLTATFMLVLAVASVFVGLNLQGALAVNYFKRPPEQRTPYLSATVAIQTAAFVVVALFAWLARRPLADATAFPAEWFVIVVACAFCQSLALSLLTLWQVEQRPMPYAVFRVLVSSANVALSVLLVVSCGWDWRGRAFGMVLSCVAGAIAAIIVLLRRGGLTLRIERRHVADALLFGLPLIPHGLSGIMSDTLNRVFINRMVSVEETGIYSVGYQIGSILLFAAVSFNFAWSPYLLERLPRADEATKIRIVRLTYAYGAAVLLAAIAIGFGAPALLWLLAGGGFQQAARFVPWTAMSSAFTGLYFMVAGYVFYSQKTYALAVVTFSSGALAVAMTWALIPRFGAIGAAYATLAGNVVVFLLTWALAQRVYPMPWLAAIRRRGDHT